MAESTIELPIIDEVVQLTVNRANMPEGNVYCIKRNGWCYIHISAAIFTSDGNAQLIISGCPKTIYQASGLVTSENGTTSLNYDSVWINQDGTQMFCHIGTGNHGKRHWICMSYPYAI